MIHILTPKHAINLEIKQAKWDYAILTTNRAARRPYASYDLSALIYDKFYCCYFESRALHDWFKKLRSYFCMVCEGVNRDQLLQQFVAAEAAQASAGAASAAPVDEDAAASGGAVVAGGGAGGKKPKRTQFYSTLKQLRAHLESDHKKFLWCARRVNRS